MELSREAYNAYSSQINETLPPFDELSEEAKKGWDAAADAVRGRVIQEENDRRERAL